MKIEFTKAELKCLYHGLISGYLQHTKQRDRIMDKMERAFAKAVARGNHPEEMENSK